MKNNWTDKLTDAPSKVVFLSDQEWDDGNHNIFVDQPRLEVFFTCISMNQWFTEAWSKSWNYFLGSRDQNVVARIPSVDQRREGPWCNWRSPSTEQWHVWNGRHVKSNINALFTWNHLWWIMSWKGYFGSHCGKTLVRRY